MGLDSLRKSRPTLRDSDAHVAGNDGTKIYSAACERRNSLQEGFFYKPQRPVSRAVFFIYRYSTKYFVFLQSPFQNFVGKGWKTWIFCCRKPKNSRTVLLRSGPSFVQSFLKE